MNKTMKAGRWLLALMAMMLLPVEALSASLKIEDFTIKGGETKTMLIDVNNADMEVTMVEFFMSLPSGLSVATENGDLAVDIAGRTTWRKHSLEATVADGVVHLLLYSGSNAVLTDTSGAVISVKLTAASAFTGGTITLEKQLLTAPDQTESKPATYTYQVTTGTVDDAVTIKARSYTREYGEANPTFGYDVTSGTITAGQPVVSCSATKTSPVGTYDIVISKGSVTNSTVNLVKGTLTITRAPLTVSAGNYTRQEGEPNPTFTPTFSGFKNGETKSVLTRQPTVSCTATTSSPAGTYPVTVSGAEAQNYSFSYVSGTLTVTPKSTPSADIITFADPEVKRLCIENWDTNNDGELSKQEAAAVTDLGWVFWSNTTITTFTELQYFTGLVSIGYRAFDWCSGLTSVTIPNSVTSIGNYAFQYCSGLTSVTIPESVRGIGDYAFQSCSGLTSVTIPNSVTSIGSYAFSYCSGLTSVTIPNSVTNIGSNPFAACSNLTKIEVQAGNTKYTSLDGVLFTKDMKTIIAYPCGKQGNTYSIPNSVTSIGSYTFSYCSGLTSVTIPNSVTSIGDYAFSGCSGLTSVTIPNSVTSIGDFAFRGCSGLTSVTIPSSVTSIGGYAFTSCSGLTSVTIPNSVTSIGDGAFSSCGSLTSVTIPNSVTSIGNYAFQNCSGLTSVTIPNSVTSIGSYTFSYCSGLTSVTIPNSVTSIGSHAFYGCRSLKEVYSQIEQPFAINDNVFQYREDGSDRFTSATLYVPRGTKSLYEATDGWKNFTKIVEMGTQLKGDVNGDNNVDVADIASVIDVMSGSAGAPPASADVNGDGQVDVADIATVIDIMAGKDVDAPEDKAPAGAEAVDLGLPSGTLWANMNIGAEKAEGYGLFFAWGETTGYSATGHTFGWANYKWMTAGQSSRFGVNKYQAADGLTAGCWYDGSGNFIGDGKTELDPEDDAARANWGGQWVMPTKADMRELIDNTTNKETTQNGVKGWVFTSKTNGKSIFFPYAGFSLSGYYMMNGSNGYYWSSTLRTANSSSAENLFIYKNGVNTATDGNERDGGFPIRAVKKAK